MLRPSRQSAIKLFVILASACLYSFVSFADTERAANDDQPLVETPAAGTTSTDPSQATAPCDPTSARTKLWGMTAEEARCRSIGCADCHKGIEDMHNGKVNLGCIDLNQWYARCDDVVHHQRGDARRPQRPRGERARSKARGGRNQRLARVQRRAKQGSRSASLPWTVENVRQPRAVLRCFE